MSATRPIFESYVFEIYIDDDRYSVPTLHLASADDEAQARAIAERLLNDNVHHLGAELYVGGRRLAVIGSFAETPQNRSEAPAVLQ